MCEGDNVKGLRRLHFTPLDLHSAMGQSSPWRYAMDQNLWEWHFDALPIAQAPCELDRHRILPIHRSVSKRDSRRQLTVACVERIIDPLKTIIVCTISYSDPVLTGSLQPAFLKGDFKVPTKNRTRIHFNILYIYNNNQLGSCYSSCKSTCNTFSILDLLFCGS